MVVTTLVQCGQVCGACAGELALGRRGAAAVRWNHRLQPHEAAQHDSARQEARRRRPRRPRPRRRQVRQGIWAARHGH